MGKNIAGVSNESFYSLPKAPIASNSLPNKVSPIAEKIIPENAQPSAPQEPLSDGQVKPIHESESGIKKIAQTIVSIVVVPFLWIGAFFARLGGGIKDLFIKPVVFGPVAIGKLAQEHLADVAIHLADVKAIGHFPGPAKKVIKPLIKGFLLDGNVLPKAFKKAKAALKDKLFAPGKAGPVLDKLEKNLVAKLGEDLAAIGCLQQNRKEGEIIAGLNARADEDMSDDELKEFAERYTTFPQYKNLLSYIQDKIRIKNLESEMKSPKSFPGDREYISDRKTYEKEITKLTNQMPHTDINSLRKGLQRKLDDAKTPIFEKQQLRLDIATLDRLRDSNKYPKTHKGVLHKAVYPLTTGELDILSERYDIIRKHYPKLQTLEDLESQQRAKTEEIKDLKRNLEEVHKAEVKAALDEKERLEEAIKKWEKENRLPVLLSKLNEKLKQVQEKYTQLNKKEIQSENEKAVEQQIQAANNDLQNLTEEIFKAREDVNLDNYATEAVLAHIQKITPDDDIHEAQLDFEIKTLTEIIGIEDKIYAHEQKYIRDISLKVFDLVYPEGLPLKLALPLRIINQNPKEFILKFLDQIIFNTIDAVSDPSFVLGTLNDRLQALNLSLQAVGEKNTQPAEAASTAEAVSHEELEKLLKETLKIGFPTLTPALFAGQSAVQFGYGVGDYLGNAIAQYVDMPKWLGKIIPNAISQPVTNFTQATRKWTVEKDYLKVAQATIEAQKVGFVHQLETAGNGLLNQGLATLDGVLFPDGKLRAFRSGYTKEEMNALQNDLEKNIEVLIENSSIPDFFKDKSKAAAKDYINRFNMQAVNKHLIYGMLDQALKALEV